MNNTDKQGLRNSTVAIKSKIIVKATTDKPEIVLTESDYIKDWEYTDDRYVPQKGFIGQFVARTLSGNLHNVSEDFNIENREIELQLGIVHLGEDSEPSWYSLGNFLITNPKDDEVRDNTKFEAMDYAKLFNKTFNGSYTDTLFTTSYNTKMENEETVTALWLAQYVCAQVNIELGNTDFVNSDYVIDINPFRNNETCRDVIKEVAKLAYSWVRIDWDNKCYIDFSVKENSSVDEYDIFTSDHYYTLETKKEKYGPINNVVVGMSNVDGESHSNPDNNSIAQNGEHAIYIYDNPLTYTFEHRERANAKGNCLFGLSYAHITCETIGFPWLRGNELISILDMENNPIYTYPFNKKITFNGHIKSTIDSMGESEVEETLAYESNVVKNARNAFINVNKQEGEIHILSQNIQNVEKEINPPENASDSEIIVEDASNNPLLYLEVEGKSTQATRSGKNLLQLQHSPGYTYTGNGVTFIVNNDYSVTVSGTATANTFLRLQHNIALTSGTYYFSGGTDGSGTHIQLNASTNYYANTGSGTKTMVFNEDLTILYVEIRIASGWTGEYTFYPMISKENTSYEPYGVSPSPDYPSEIKSVGTYIEETGKYGIEIETTNGTDVNTLSIVLNQPLRSLPNGVKDIAYIKNNRLYVDHYIGSEVFDGSESSWLENSVTKGLFQITLENITTDMTKVNAMSNYFKGSSATDIVNSWYTNNSVSTYTSNRLFFRSDEYANNLDGFKTWLSTNNVQVDYELAEPYTEEIGEIDTLKTLLGYNKITTIDDLKPTLNITYVRDTVLADYVENHIAELKINEEQISQRVETIDTSVDGLQTDISRVEQITTDTSQVLNIVSTNINKTTGDVNAVTTRQKKFTFNDEGLKISAGENGFNSVQDETGTYYYDGTTPVGQYTKDGSKQKDLELFGTYSYGKRDIDDTPMFVGQLYTDENGDEGFGHFVNI